MAETSGSPAGKARRPDLSVLIASWNTRDLLADLLGSLQNFPAGVPTEVIVVENGSADGSAAMVKERFPEVTLIENIHNRGYAAGNNQAMAASKGKMVVLLGSDCRVLKGSLSTMLEYLGSHPTVGAVACRLENPDGTPQLSCRRFPRLRDAAATYLSLHCLVPAYTMRGFDFSAVQEVDQPAATCLMIRREALRETKLFDECLSILYNDVDLCERIHRAGWKIIYHGGAAVVHHGSRSTTQALPALRAEMYRNILRYYTRRFGIRALLLLLPILSIRLTAATRGRGVPGLFRFREYLS